MSFLMLLFQSSSVRSSCPVFPTYIRDGFFSCSFDCALLQTRARIEPASVGSVGADAGISSGAFCDCFVLFAIVTRVAMAASDTEM